MLTENSTALMRDEQANLLTANNYLCSLFTTDNDVIDSSRLPEKVPNRPVGFMLEVVLKHIKKLKANSSVGPDRLPASFSKVASDCIALPLSIIFNLSLQSGIIPDIWKYASVVPVFKKGSPGDPCHYRPISLSCIACILMV